MKNNLDRMLKKLIVFVKYSDVKLSKPFKKSFYNMAESDLRRLHQLEEKNRRLKHMYAELSIDHKILKDFIKKSYKAGSTLGIG